MLRNLTRGILIFGVAFSVVAQIRAFGETGDEQYKEKYERIVGNIRTEMRGEMRSDEAKYEQNIRYSVEISSVINAYARHQSGEDLTVMTTGFLFLIDNLSTAMALGGKFDALPCAEAYFAEASDVFARNRELESNGKPPKYSLASAFEYFPSHRDVCPSVGQHQFEQNINGVDDTRELSIRECLKYILLHELGHHLHNDTKSEVGAEEQRIRERNADKFAFRVMSSSRNDNPLAAIAALLFMCGSDNYSVEDLKSNHPSSISRLQSMIDVAEGEMDSFTAGESAETRAKYKAVVDTLRDVMQRRVAEQSGTSARSTSPSSGGVTFAGGAPPQAKTPSSADEEAIQACVDKEKNDVLGRCYAGSEKCNEIVSKHEAKWRQLCANHKALEHELHKQ
jgi:hypothetical protein